MQTITFYAYKGGTGRTLALTRAANFLADDGKRVFVLDLDLEAPGLHFKLLEEEQRKNLCPGFVELAHEYVNTGVFALLDGHYVRVNRPTGAKGEIFLMPAGRALSGDYWRQLTELNWQQMFGVEYGEGVPLFLKLQELIDEACHPDFLLIDSRTGVTEVGGAALTLLADAVVCLFSNNEESKWGTREAIRTIGVAARPPEKQPVRIVPVLARFPAGLQDEDQRLQKLQEYMQVERIFVLHSDREVEVDERLALNDERVNSGPLAGDYSHREIEVDEPDTLSDKQTSSGPLARDYRALFEDGLKIVLESLRETAQIETATLARGTDEAVAQWLDLLAGMMNQQAPEMGDVLKALKALEAELGADSRYPEVVPQLEAVSRWRDASVEVRATAAQLLALELGRLGRFEAISAEVLGVAQTMAPGHKDTLRRLLHLYDSLGKARVSRDTADTAMLRRLHDAMIEDLAGRLGKEGELERAIAMLQSRLQEDDEPGALLLLRIRHQLGNLLRESGKLSDAEDSLRRAADGYGLRGEKWKLVQEDLARVLDAQQRSAEAAAVRKRLAGDQRPKVVTRHPPEKLPEKRPRATRTGLETASFAVPLQLVTTLLGGAAETRTIDDEDVVRVPSIRGHLRFWWRALQREPLSSEELSARERTLWGGIGDDTGRRSAVELRVEIKARGEINRSDVIPYGRDQTRGAYALWPARETKHGPDPQPVAPRRDPGTCFVLHVACPMAEQRDTEAAIRAWILFGGYGGRTRRGAGSLAIDGGVKERERWLPTDRTREALRAVFQQDILAPIAARSTDDVPLLAGAGLRLGAPTGDAMAAWLMALDWLRDFRQQQPGSGRSGDHDPSFARDRGDGRPGRSNWPEADKVRQLTLPKGARWAHEPRHNDKPVWPRAGFGLPIIARFQRTDRRTRAAYPPPGEPDDFELRWRDAKGKSHDRLASPLIVKALALADGGFVPCALWLHRAYPRDSEVILHPKDSRSERSAAGFDELVAPGDSPQYAPLQRAQSGPPGERLRNAFFEWLAVRDPKVRKVSP